MNRFHLMTVFVAVTEEQSFAGAARRLGMSPPAVTRAIAALEDRLKVKLLTRTTRFVRATDAGLRYLEHARRIIAELDEADDAAVGVDADPRGLLSITAPVLFGRMFVMPSVVNYLGRYPDMSISMLFLDRIVNLLEEGMDVGIRIGELPDSTMKAVSVGHVRRVVCASPDYLKHNGVPQTPLDLAKHTVIAASAVTPTVEWQFVTNNKKLSVKVNPRLTVTNNDAAIQAALQGFGITRLMSYQLAPHLASGQLQTILSAYEQPRLPIHVLHSEGRQASAKVRTFVDMLVDRLRTDKTLN
jgi:DNA-binding transcriptional LysR family regulator